MLYSSQALAEISRQRDGKLQDLPFAVLLHAFRVEERTAVLEIKRNQMEKKIYFEEGVPVSCHSNLLHETLGKQLIDHKKISEEDNQNALVESASTGERLGEIFLKWQKITAFDLFKELQQNLAQKLLDGFTWVDGTFHVLAELPEVDSPMKMNVPQLIVSGLTRFAPQLQVDHGIATWIGKKLSLHPSPFYSKEELKLPPKQARLIKLLEKGVRLDEMLLETNLPAEEISRLVYALGIMGMVTLQEHLADLQPPLSPQKPMQEKSAAPVSQVTAPSISAAAIEKLQNEVSEAYLNHRKQDAFDLLGVHTDAIASAIRKSYLAFAERYAPWKFSDPEMKSIAEKAEGVFLAGARAFAQLNDPEQKSRLLAARQHKSQVKKAKPGASFAIRTDLLDAEKQFQEGRKKMSAGDYAGALQFFEFAVDCDPQKALYLADLAYCRFMANPRNLASCLEQVSQAQTLDPECGLAYYYAGEMKRKSGDRLGAEADLRRATKLMAGDRRPTEALRELMKVKA